MSHSWFPADVVERLKDRLPHVDGDEGGEAETALHKIRTARQGHYPGAFFIRLTLEEFAA
jgi:hypothetical protein